MSDWKSDLNNKFNIIKKEVTNGVCVETNSSLRAGDSSGRRSNADLPDLRKKELKNLTKGGKVMITKEAALDDLEKIDVNAPVGKVIIEVGRILIKILATIRSNQLLTEEEKVKIREARKVRDARKPEVK